MATNPFWTGCACAGAAAFLLTVRGRAGWKLILGMALAFIVLLLANGLFNPQGRTVLFTYFGRPYTLESVLYGTQTAGMFVAVMLLFGSYDRVMTADRFTYLFGHAMPAITLVLTMVLRLVPDYLRKAKQIASARDGIGKGAAESGFGGRVRHGSAILGALTTWALEAGVVTADSMRSRGYGTRKTRTQHARYRFGARDVVMLAVLIVCVGLAFAGVFSGASSVDFLPRIAFPPVTGFSMLSFLAYAAFMFTPFVVDAGKRISWRSSISKI